MVMKKILHLFLISFLCFALVSCEVLTRFFLYPSECYTCEIRSAENRWSEEPYWRDDACGGSVVRLKDSCDFKAKEMNAECICIQYQRD
jgi:hypothetical protein